MNTVLNFASWIVSDSRRAYVMLSLVILVVVLTLVAMPDGAALAEDIVGGS